MKKFFFLLIASCLAIFLVSLNKAAPKKKIETTKSHPLVCDCRNVTNLTATDYGTNQTRFDWSAPSGGDPVDHYSYGGFYNGSWGGFSGTTTELYVILDKHSGGTFRVRTIVKESPFAQVT